MDDLRDARAPAQHVRVAATEERPGTPDDVVLAAEALMAAAGGVLTRRQALACGLTPAQFATQLRRGRWTALRRGVVTASAAQALDRGAEHALAVAARAARYRGTHAGSHRSAALVLGLPVLGRPPSPVQLVRAPRSRSDVATAPGLHVATLPDDHLVTCRGVVVTSAARTVCDIARTRPFREGVLAADAALHAGLPRAELTAVLGTCAGWPGAAGAARVVAFADERAESPLESLDRVAFLEAGLPAPRTQVDVVAARGDWLGRVDFLFEQERTVVEADGLAKYRLDEGAAVPAWARDALVQEKRRELGLRANGLEVVRNDWDEAFRRPGELAGRVQHHFWLASRYPPLPGVRFEQRPVRRPPPEWPLEAGASRAA